MVRCYKSAQGMLAALLLAGLGAACKSKNWGRESLSLHQFPNSPTVYVTNPKCVRLACQVKIKCYREEVDGSNNNVTGKTAPLVIWIGCALQCHPIWCYFATKSSAQSMAMLLWAS